MDILTRDSLPLSGFAGITEHRLVTDSRLFGHRKTADTFEGLGNMVYLADARYLPNGASGMHPHSEVDVISIIIEGRVSHEGSLEHGKDLVAGEVQVQRAGGEGFSHNEINPDTSPNRMLQVWALPEKAGQPAGYKSYIPAQSGNTRIYGGSAEQTETFDSHTLIDITYLKAGEQLALQDKHLVYTITGAGNAVAEQTSQALEDGTLIRATNPTITATSAMQLLVISHAFHSE